MTLSETMAALNHELADFSLPKFGSSSDAGPMALAFKEVSNNLADLSRDIATSNSNSRRRVRFIELKRLVTSLEELADIRLSRFPSNSLLEIKKLSPNGAKIKVLASAFGMLDLQHEIVDPGAFAASLAAHRRAGTQPKMLWQHDTHEICGLWTSLAEDSKGLMAEGLVLDSVQRGKEAIALLEAGAELGCSIGFRAVRDRVINKVRHLQEVDLLEISLVTFPSSPGTRIHLSTKEYGNRSDAKILVDLERASDFSLARFG